MPSCIRLGDLIHAAPSAEFNCVVGPALRNCGDRHRQQAYAEDIAGVVSRMQKDLSYLASDELAGRDVGSDGIAKAGEFIAQRFKDLGLETDKFDGGLIKSLHSCPSALGDPAKNTLAFKGLMVCQS